MNVIEGYQAIDSQITLTGPFRNDRGSGGTTNARELLRTLVGQGVHYVINTDADAERGKLLIVLGVVGVLPGIAEIHVVTNGDHQAALVVVDPAPARRNPILLVGPAGPQILGTGHLIALVDVAND